MKIGFLITYFYPKSGGAENNCYFLARELAKRHEVHVFCSGEKDEDVLIEGIRVHRSKELFRFKYYLAYYPSLIKSLARFKLDILHVHGFGFMQHDIAIKKLKAENPELKIVCTPHGPFMALKKYNLLGSIFKRAYLPSIRKSLEQYDRIIEVNPYQEEWMKKEYGISKKKIVFLPNGIVKDSFRKINGNFKKLLASKHGFEGKNVISYLGRIQKYKGIEQIIKALPLIEDKKVIFLAMGKDVGDKKRLLGIARKLNVEKRVVFIGEVNENEKLALLDMTKIFVFPSEWEAFGIVVLEAMARGNPIISSKTEGGRYLIEEGKNGYLFEYGDEKTLARRIDFLLNKGELRKRISLNNFKKAKRFLWNDIALKLEEIYKEVLKH